MKLILKKDKLREAIPGVMAVKHQSQIVRKK